METTENTKKCPYCGEDILTTAKKCKHCGEWLDEEKTPSNLSKSVDYTLYIRLCYIAMIFVLGEWLTTGAYYTGQNTMHTGLIFTLGGSILWVVLLLAISKYSKRFLDNEKIPFTFLIVMEIIGSIFYILMRVNETVGLYIDGINVVEILGGLHAIVLILYIIAVLITGSGIKKLKGNSWFSALGITLIVHTVAIVTIFFIEERIGLILSFIIQICLLQVTRLLFKEAKKNDKRKKNCSA